MKLKAALICGALILSAAGVQADPADSTTEGNLAELEARLEATRQKVRQAERELGVLRQEAETEENSAATKSPSGALRRVGSCLMEEALGMKGNLLGVVRLADGKELWIRAGDSLPNGKKVYAIGQKEIRFAGGSAQMGVAFDCASVSAR